MMLSTMKTFIFYLYNNILLITIKLFPNLFVTPEKKLKLHLGCGKRPINNYVNIDARKTTATDLVCSVIKLPYPDESVEIIETYHVIEHLPRHDLPVALSEWRRLLVDGGRLIIECPDFDRAVKEYVDGNESRIDNIFGLQRYEGDYHLFGYNYKRLKELLEHAGFREIIQKDPTDYHVQSEPCMRVESIK